MKSSAHRGFSPTDSMIRGFRSAADSIPLLIALILAGVSAFVARRGTAYEWPAIDVGPALINHEGGLSGDFTAEMTSGLNPRTPFVLLCRGLAWSFGGDWLVGLTAVKAMVVVALPALMFLALYSLTERLLPRGPARWAAAVVLALAVLGGMFEVLTGWFVVAQWRPLPLQATPQALALTIACAGAVLALHRRRVAAQGCVTVPSTCLRNIS